jgi:membrane-bound hydrogenase subunit beta
VTGMFPAADCYERELVDLLGFEVQGLPPGNRYPLPDGWPDGQHPLLKDWKIDMLDAPAAAAAPAADEVDHA